MQVTIAQWCRDCGMDLLLSADPLVLDEDHALCDICKDRLQNRYGSATDAVVGRQHKKLSDNLQKLERELEDVECEIDQLEHDKRDIEFKIHQFTKRLKGK